MSVVKGMDLLAIDYAKDRTMIKSHIQFGIDAELDKALSQFCGDELRLSKIYWPQPFRALIMTVLQSLLKNLTCGKNCPH